MADPTCDEIQQAMRDVQDHICEWLIGAARGQAFHEDLWEYKKGSGGGRTRVWEGTASDVIEKGGVNFSAIHGSNLPSSSTGSPLAGVDTSSGFTATGVSLVIHPKNPHIPTIHMNVRYFESGDNWWFGGGIDLTPYYPDFELVKDFHVSLEALCKAHDHPYEAYKHHCDEYFTLKHRGEMRGVGGIFFDQLKAPSTKRALLRFVESLGIAFTTLYAPFFQNVDLAYSAAQREYQLWRRSRYVEFNLLFDRGTKFGIESSGRAESILMSLPTVCKWHYDVYPSEGTVEGNVHRFYLQPQDWVNLKPGQAPAITNLNSDFERYAVTELPNLGLSASLIGAGFVLGAVFVGAAALIKGKLR